MGCRLGEGGGTVVLGEMGVTWVSHTDLARTPLPPPSALGLVPTPPANGVHPIPGVILGLPLTRWKMFIRPVLHRALGMGDDV